MSQGIIVKAVSGFYYVDSGNGVFECKARGIFRKNNESPLVGDRVEFTPLSQNTGIVDGVLPRTNFLLRPPIANIDKLFIVSSFSTPAPSPLVIDTMTTIAEDKEIEPIIVFNKCDMGSFEDFSALYKSCGFKVYVVSAENNIGIGDLKCELADSVSVFAGNTGVGKSSLLNALFPSLTLKTGEVSEKLGRGRHTTRHVELFSSGNNGFVADTPGFSSIELDEANFIYKENLQFAFREFSEHIGQCRFSSCTHMGEKGCSVMSALECGDISESRYNSYKHLYFELSKYKDWEIKKNIQ